MILGAGLGQLPIIQAAVDLGFYTITVDNVPGNVGHRFSHQSVDCSTADQSGVLAAAAKLKIDGIVTFASDVATQSVGYVADQLGLAGSSQAVAKIMSNKARFRAFQKQHGGRLNYPNFVTGKSLNEIADEVTCLAPPLIFKPVDSSGSRGVVKVESVDWSAYKRAFEYAQSYARSKVVCVEEFVEGEESGGDGFLVDGKLVALITQKRKLGFVPIGHSLPTDLAIDVQGEVLTELAAHCRALGYSNGPLNFDVLVSPQRIVVLEMSPRLGGNGISAVIKRATGVDLIAATLGLAVGRPPELADTLKVTRSCGSWVFGSAQAGRLDGIASKAELCARAPEVFGYAVNYNIGDEVPGFVHSGNSLGYVLFDIAPGCDYPDIVERIQDALQMVVA